MSQHWYRDVVAVSICEVEMDSFSKQMYVFVLNSQIYCAI